MNGQIKNMSLYHGLSHKRAQARRQEAGQWVVTRLSKDGTPSKRVNASYNLFTSKSEAERRSEELERMNPGKTFVVSAFDANYFVLIND